MVSLVLLLHLCLQVLNDPLQLAFSATYINVQNEATLSKPATTEGLPGNVHLLTSRWLSCTRILVRLSHMFQAGEDKLMSQSATVKLAAVAQLLKLKVTHLQEATLFGERALSDSDATRPQYNISEKLTMWQPPLLLPPTALSSSSNRIVGPIPLDTSVTLHPMQVRAFYFTVSRSTLCSDPARQTLPKAGAVPAAAAMEVEKSKTVSVLVRHLPGADQTVAQVASLSHSVLLLLLLVPTGIAVGMAAVCLVGRSYMQRIVTAGTKQDKMKSIARNEYINL